MTPTLPNSTIPGNTGQGTIRTAGPEPAILTDDSTETIAGTATDQIGKPAIGAEVEKRAARPPGR
jgi:hypothetical protein